LPHTFSSNLVHIIFSTKDRRPFITQCEPLWAYIRGIAKNHDIPLLAVGGMPDHAHILVALPPTIALAQVVVKLKANSSRWIKGQVHSFAWQEGYAAFSVSPSQADVVAHYIARQALHHAQRDFAAEFAALLRKSGMHLSAAHAAAIRL
jgi:putative transposase